MSEPQAGTGGTEPPRASPAVPAAPGRIADPVRDTRWSRLLVQVNAVVWTLLLPTGALSLAFPDWPQLQVAILVVWFVAAVFGNLAGSLGLAHAHGRLGGSGLTVIAGALIQFLAIVGPAALAGYVLLLEAYRQIEDSGPALAVAAIVAAVLYPIGQVVTAVSLRTLSRRLAIWYGAAPALFLGYGAAAVIASVSEYDLSDNVWGVILGVVAVGGAIGFFVAMPVIWFRLAVQLRRRAHALAAR